ncbi:MAG: hypothetical protein IJK62_14970 [Bacteroidales bacterium]|nr:hypothetical protein [Bacteroidales bacterium]
MKALLPIWIKFVGLAIIGIGIVLLVLSAIDGNISLCEYFSRPTSLNVLASNTIILVGLILVAFSRDKNEQDSNMELRHKAFFWSVLIHCAFFMCFSFSHTTVLLISFPAIILMNSLIAIYIILYRIFKLKKK